MIAAILRSAFERADRDYEKIDTLLAEFVRTALVQLQGNYDEVFGLFWHDPEVAHDGLRRYVAAFLLPEPDWPWPIAERPPSSGRPHPQFEKCYSGLWLRGYRVGKTKGMARDKRQRFVDHYFRNTLPAVVAKYHGDSYGEPGSEQRLRKLANVLATNCHNFKLNDCFKYRQAIDAYETDLAYLKRRCYHAGMFPWPPAES